MRATHVVYMTLSLCLVVSSIFLFLKEYKVSTFKMFHVTLTIVFPFIAYLSKLYWIESDTPRRKFIKIMKHLSNLICISASIISLGLYIDNIVKWSTFLLLCGFCLGCVYRTLLEMVYYRCGKYRLPLLAKNDLVLLVFSISGFIVLVLSDIKINYGASYIWTIVFVPLLVSCISIVISSIRRLIHARHTMSSFDYWNIVCTIYRLLLTIFFCLWSPLTLDGFINAKYYPIVPLTLSVPMLIYSIYSVFNSSVGETTINN